MVSEIMDRNSCSTAPVASSATTKVSSRTAPWQEDRIARAGFAHKLFRFGDDLQRHKSLARRVGKFGERSRRNFAAWWSDHRFRVVLWVLVVLGLRLSRFARHARDYSLKPSRSDLRSATPASSETAAAAAAVSAACVQCLRPLSLSPSLPLSLSFSLSLSLYLRLYLRLYMYISIYINICIRVYMYMTKSPLQLP